MLSVFDWKKKYQVRRLRRMVSKASEKVRSLKTNSLEMSFEMKIDTYEKSRTT